MEYLNTLCENYIIESNSSPKNSNETIYNTCFDYVNGFMDDEGREILINHFNLK